MEVVVEEKEETTMQDLPPRRCEPHAKRTYSYFCRLMSREAHVSYISIIYAVLAKGTQDPRGSVKDENHKPA